LFQPINRFIGTGVMGLIPNTPIFHYSNTPFLIDHAETNVCLTIQRASASALLQRLLSPGLKQRDRLIDLLDLFRRESRNSLLDQNFRKSREANKEFF
jgi:hypothetical protein